MFIGRHHKVVSLALYFIVAKHFIDLMRRLPALLYVNDAETAFAILMGGQGYLYDDTTSHNVTCLKCLHLCLHKS